MKKSLYYIATLLTILAVVAVFNIYYDMDSSNAAENVAAADNFTYPIVATAQNKCYDQYNSVINCASASSNLYGQDAQYISNKPSYSDNGDGTVTDNVTGLMWQQKLGSKMSWQDAVNGAASFNLAGYNDWRLPNIKELYSLINFSGSSGTPQMSGYGRGEPNFYQVPDDASPYIDTRYLNFDYGDVNNGERYIDAQEWSSTKYVGFTMNGETSAFGVNFADGRIKAYGTQARRRQDLRFARYVRGNLLYGKNKFVDNGDGTISDQASGLMWMSGDSGSLGAGSGRDGKLNWSEALKWCENLEYANHSDWRLPNAKELQSIVDYSRAPAATQSAAIDPIFKISKIKDEGGRTNWPFFWTSTTHLDGPPAGPGGSKSTGFAIYVAFGQALGMMRIPPDSSNTQLLDVHGAGAQRSSPKFGNEADFPVGAGPQGDVIRVNNFARCVR